MKTRAFLLLFVFGLASATASRVATARAPKLRGRRCVQPGRKVEEL